MHRISERLCCEHIFRSNWADHIHNEPRPDFAFPFKSQMSWGTLLRRKEDERLPQGLHDHAVGWARIRQIGVQYGSLAIGLDAEGLNW